MRGYFTELIGSSRSLVLGMWLGIICLVTQWVILGLFIWQLPPEIPLWYSLPSGRLQLADRNWFWLLPGLSLVMSLVNLLILKYSGPGLKIYISLQLWLTTVALFLMTIAMVNIIRLVL